MILEIPLATMVMKIDFMVILKLLTPLDFVRDCRHLFTVSCSYLNNCTWQFSSLKYEKHERSGFHTYLSPFGL